MSTATLIGLAAGALTTTSWLPQVIRAFRTRSTRDFAWSWFAMFGVGVGGWLIYGIVAGSPSVIATNALTLALVLGLGWLKLRHSTEVDLSTAGDDHSTAGDHSTTSGHVATGGRPGYRRKRQNRSPAHIPAP
jgi:MtN3 and saliva related transmembrane protein